MNNTSQYITKKDFYSFAVNICVLIFFTGALSDHEPGWGRPDVAVGVWAMFLALYYSVKASRTKKTRANDLNTES